MTREEAIIRLKGLYGNGYTEQEQALDMAITALSAIEDIKQEIWISHKDNYCKSQIVNLIDKHLKGESE